MVYAKDKQLVSVLICYLLLFNKFILCEIFFFIAIVCSKNNRQKPSKINKS